MKKLLLLLAAVMVLGCFSGISAIAATGIDISCVDGEIVVSGSFDGTDAVGETYNVVLETYDEDGTTLLKTDTSTAATVVSGTNEFLFKADIIANVQPTKAYITTSGNKTVVTPAEKTLYSLKVLAIGNSFSVDAMRWLYDIATDMGVDNVVLGNLYIGGCSLQTHANNASNNSASYTYYKNTTGTWATVGTELGTTMLYGIQDEDWNLITVQQVSNNSGKADTFEPYLTNLIDYVNANKTNQYAKTAWHMTWAYAEDSTHSGFANYSNDQLTMFNAILDATIDADIHEGIDFVIPAGTAIQNARTSVLGDTLCRDGYHLNMAIGRYIAGVTWFHKITGLNIDGLDCLPSTDSTFTLENVQIAIKSAKAAVLNPYRLTNLAGDEDTDEDIMGVVVSDDFESYDQEVKTVSTTVDDTTTYNLQPGGGRYIAQTDGANATAWYASSADYFGVADAARAGIVQNPAKLGSTDEQDNVLAIEGRCTYTAWGSRARVIYQNYKPNNNYKHTYKFDFYKGSNVSGGGIIFNFAGGNSTKLGNADHYAIDFVGRNDHGYGYSAEATDVYSTVVIKNGEWQQDAVINTSPETTTVSRVAHDFIPSQEWYTVEVTVEGGEISWTVKDASSGTVKQTGSWTDPEPLETEMTSFALYAGGDYNAYTYFDNVSVEKSSVTDDDNTGDDTTGDDTTGDDNTGDDNTGDDTGSTDTTGTVVTDDFEAYDLESADVTSLTTGGNRYVAQINDVDSTTWEAASSGFGDDGNAHAGITADPADSTNNVLAIESRAGYSNWSGKPKIFYKNLAANSNDTYTYKFDFYKSANTAGGGIMVSYDGTNYYAVDFVGRNDHGYGYSDEATEVYSTVAIKNGEYKTDAVINTDPETTTISRVAHDFIPSAAWYTMELTVAGGSLNWTVKLTSTGATVQTGSWTDSSPITGDSLSFALFAGGQRSEYMYFDNVTVTKTTGTEDDGTVEDGVIYSDNFNSYTAVSGVENYVTANNAVVAGQWMTAGNNWGFSATNLPGAGIIVGSKNSNVLVIDTKAAYNAPKAFVPVEPIDLEVDTSYAHTYKFDIYRADSQGGGGIRFNKTGTWTSFYELYFQGTNGWTDGTLKTSLSKVTTENSEVTYTRFDETEVSVTGDLANNMITQSVWYTVELTVDGGNIRWTVTEKDSGTTVQSGSYTDESPLVSPNASVALFGAGQGGNYVHFDNFSVSRSAVTKPRYHVYGETLTVEFSPEAIDDIENISKLQIMVASYESGTNKLLSVEIKEITDLTSYISEDFAFDKNADTKVYIWNGELADAAPSHKPFEVEYEEVSHIDASSYKAQFNNIKTKWANNANDGTTTAFIGDSYITSYFWSDFETTYSGKDAQLIGISATTTYDWLPCIDEVFGDIAPDNIVIHLGTNDFYNIGASAPYVIKNVKDICETIHEMYPETKIYYIAITQRTDTTYAADVDTSNEMIASWCDSTDYTTFVDTRGLITSDMMKSDGVHMNLSGYEVFVSALENAGCVIENK